MDRATKILSAWGPVAAGALLVFAAATYTRADADLWGHLRFGLDILQTRELAIDDPYSFTQDRPWLNHEWLSELLMALAYKAGGTAGLVILKAGFISGAFLMIWTALRDVRPFMRAVIMIALAFGTIHITSSLRPQVWTFFCFAILCRALTANDPRRRWWLPLVFVFWANLHGGWLVGLGVLGVWTVGEALTRRRPVLELTALVIACAAATLGTPYGWKLWEFVAHTVRMERTIDEWQPVWTRGAPNWIPWLVTTGVVLWAVRHVRQNRLSTFAVLAVLAYSAARVMRVGSLYMEATALWLAPVFGVRWPRQALNLQPRNPGAQLFAAVYLLAISIAASGWIMKTSLRCMPILAYYKPEPEPVRWLASAADGRVITAFNWGEYAIWHLGPRLKVSMDGRRETVYSNRRLAEHDAILAGTPDGLSTLSQWNPEYVWLPSRSATTKKWLVEHGYRIEFDTPQSFIAVRDDLPRLKTPAPVPAATARCFPG